MKKVKNYIDIELAKKKIDRYSFWCIKDETGITIASSESNNPDSKTFEEYLDKINADNIDAEVQIKYGTNELSSRSNPPLFIRINEEIEWVEAEPEETVSINGVPHKLDKNGNVNINLTTPEKINEPKAEVIQMDHIRTEMDLQLSGLRKEYELKEEKWRQDMHNQLMEQTLKFKEMMLTERETRVTEKEQSLAFREQEISQKEEEMKDKVKSVIKQTTPALGSLVMGMLSSFKASPSADLGEVKKEEPREKPQRTKVAFDIQEDEPEIEEPIEEQEETEEIIDYPMEEEYLTLTQDKEDEDIQDIPTDKSE